jgi:hypothetical protein
VLGSPLNNVPSLELNQNIVPEVREIVKALAAQVLLAVRSTFYVGVNFCHH